MAARQIVNLGNGGVNYDLPPALLPEQVFSDVRNVRFRNQSVESITGESVYAVLDNNPEYGLHWQRPDGRFNLFLKDDQAIVIDAAGALLTFGSEYAFGVITDECNTGDSFLCASVTDYTGLPTVNTYVNAEIFDIEISESIVSSEATGDYTNSQWRHCYFNGGYAVVLNNGKSTPLYTLYDGVTSGISDLEPLPGWNYQEDLEVTAKVIKPLGYSLVAANLTLYNTDTETTVYAPSTVRISVQAPTGGFPQIWEPGLTTDTADEFDLSTTSPIIDMAELRGSMFIYSSTNIHILTINTGVTRVQPYSDSYGILNTDCVVEFEGKHLVVDRNDIYVHNGSGAIESIGYDRIKDYFFKNINYQKVNLVTVKKNIHKKEIWVCYPKGNSNLINEALIFNYKNNTWTIRDLPQITSLFVGPYINPLTNVVSEDTLYFLTGKPTVLIADESYHMFNPNTGNLESYDSYVRKEKINTGDLLGSVLVSSITPVFDKVPEDKDINIKVTSQNTFLEGIDWDDPKSLFVFKPSDLRNQGYKIDPRVNGRFLSYEIRSQGPWRLSLIGLEAAPKDRR
jgi:hypothetical protein